MPKVASEFFKEEKKAIQIQATHSDYEFLKGLADQASVTQGFVLHVLFEMLQLIVGSSVESGVIDENSKISNLEAYAALTMRQLGLLTDDEFDRAIMVAEAMNGERVDLRLRGLAALANERIDQLRPIWEAARAEAEKRRSEWDPQVAALRQSIAANVGAQMVELDKEASN